MSEPDVLERKISELKRQQRTAWRRIGDPSVPRTERQKIRNQIKEIDHELRHQLAVMAVRLELEARKLESDEGNSPANVEFRILSAHLDPF